MLVPTALISLFVNLVLGYQETRLVSLFCGPVTLHKSQNAIRLAIVARTDKDQKEQGLTMTPRVHPPLMPTREIWGFSGAGQGRNCPTRLIEVTFWLVDGYIPEEGNKRLKPNTHKARLHDGTSVSYQTTSYLSNNAFIAWDCPLTNASVVRVSDRPIMNHGREGYRS